MSMAVLTDNHKSPNAAHVGQTDQGEENSSHDGYLCAETEGHFFIYKVWLKGVSVHTN